MTDKYTQEKLLHKSRPNICSSNRLQLFAGVCSRLHLAGGGNKSCTRYGFDLSPSPFSIITKRLCSNKPVAERQTKNPGYAAVTRSQRTAFFPEFILLLFISCSIFLRTQCGHCLGLCLVGSVQKTGRKCYKSRCRRYGQIKRVWIRETRKADQNEQFW